MMEIIKHCGQVENNVPSPALIALWAARVTRV